MSIPSFEELPRALIQARIARGLTQRQLAERLGLKEQQIQRYEATGYASASLKRVGAVIQALDLQVHEEIAVR
jgi:transcriptional regulator with XRE-family HTH domain